MSGTTLQISIYSSTGVVYPFLFVSNRGTVEDCILNEQYVSILEQLTKLRRGLTHSKQYFMSMPISSSLGRALQFQPYKRHHTRKTKAQQSSALVFYISHNRLWYENEVEDVRFVMEQSLRLRVCVTTVFPSVTMYQDC